MNLILIILGEFCDNNQATERKTYWKGITLSTMCCQKKVSTNHTQELNTVYMFLDKA